MVLAASQVVNLAAAPTAMAPGKCVESSRASLVVLLVLLPAVDAMVRVGLSLSLVLIVRAQARKSVSVIS
jgi:hypothetical protein